MRNIEIFVRDLLKKPPRPYKLLLELNSICNSKCKTCHIWLPQKDATPSEIKLNELEIFLKSHGSDLLWIALSGGEITIYDSANDLFALIRKTCPALRILTFTTNALKPEVALQLALECKKTAPDHFITISLDGDKKTHDFVRGVKGNFAKAIATYEMMKRSGVHVHFGLTSSSYNADFIQLQYTRWARKIRALSFAHSGGIYRKENESSSPQVRNSLDSLIRHYRIQNLSESIEYLYLHLARQFFATQQLPVPCEVISTSLHVRPNGDIHPCMYLPKLGHIGDPNNKDFLQKAQVSELRIQARQGQCKKCWMNCYAPHSIMRHPLKAVTQLLWPHKHASQK